MAVSGLGRAAGVACVCRSLLCVRVPLVLEIKDLLGSDGLGGPSLTSKYRDAVPGPTAHLKPRRLRSQGEPGTGRTSLPECASGVGSNPGRVGPDSHPTPTSSLPWTPPVTVRRVLSWAKHLPGAGDRHDRGVANSIVRAANPGRINQWSAATVTGGCSGRTRKSGVAGMLAMSRRGLSGRALVRASRSPRRDRAARVPRLGFTRKRRRGVYDRTQKQKELRAGWCR